jgi:hypothetical protein
VRAVRPAWHFDVALFVIGAAILAVLLCIAAPGQGVRVALRDGQVIDQIGPGEQRHGALEVSVRWITPGKHARILARNRGAPEWKPAAREPNPSRVFLDGVLLAVPKGLAPEWAAFRDTRPAGTWQGQDLYVAIDRHSQRPVYPGVPESAAHAMLSGGDTVWWDIVEGHRQAPPVLGDIPDRCRRLLFVDGPVTQWPYVNRLRSLYTASAGSAKFSAPTADLGWWVLWAGQRHTQGRIPDPWGWYAFGATLWADGHSNHHYDPERQCVANWLRTGDSDAWVCARTLTEAKVRAGFTWCDAGDVSQRHRWRYEKSSFGGYVGDYWWCTESHEWDTGALMVAHLGQDPDLFEAMRLRGERLLVTPADAVHKRYWGPRNAAWHLENLRAFWVMTGDVRFRNSAESKIRWWFGQLPVSDTRWMDLGDPGLWYPWQTSMMCVQVAAWIHEGVAPEVAGRVAALARTTIDEGTRILTINGATYLQGAMLMGTRQQWNAPILTSNFLPLLAIAKTWDPSYQDRWEAAMRAIAGGVFQSWSDVGKPVMAGEDSFRGTAYGFGTEKAYHDAAWGLSDPALR